MSAGKSLFQSFLSGHPACTAQVMEESNQVSSTSFSGLNSLPPHLGHFSIFGLSTRGSIGTQSGSASIISLHFSQYHIGIGVANTRCRDITQSHSSDLAQSIKRCFMKSGYQVISEAFFSTSSVRTRVFMNHCSLSKISTGVLHLQQVLTSCSMLSVFSSNPSAFNSLRIAFFASVVESVAYLPAFFVILPFSSILIMTGR